MYALCNARVYACDNNVNVMAVGVLGTPDLGTLQDRTPGICCGDTTAFQGVWVVLTVQGDLRASRKDVSANSLSSNCLQYYFVPLPFQDGF